MPAKLYVLIAVATAAAVLATAAAADSARARAHRHLAGCHERGRACEVHDHACHHEASECYMSAGEAAQEHLPLAAQYASVHALACRAAHWIAAGKPSIKPEGMASCMMPDPRNLLQLDAEARRRLNHVAAHVAVNDCDNFNDVHGAMAFQADDVRSAPNRPGAASTGAGMPEGLNHGNGYLNGDAYYRLEVQVEEGNVVHDGSVASPVYNVDGTSAVIHFEFDSPTDDNFCVFDFGDPSGTYGLTMSWHINIDNPRWASDDDDSFNHDDDDSLHIDDDDSFHHDDFDDNWHDDFDDNWDDDLDDNWDDDVIHHQNDPGGVDDWNDDVIHQNDPGGVDDDHESHHNFVALFVVNYETGDWRRVFLTGDTGDYAAEYTADVYAAPGEFIRWVAYVDDDGQLDASAYITFGSGLAASFYDDDFDDDSEPEVCDPNAVVPEVKFLPATGVWVTTEAQDGAPDYHLDGVDFWQLSNAGNSRNFAVCAGPEDDEVPEV